MPHPIARPDVQRLVEAGTGTVVEVLSAAAFDQGHLPGALHLDLENLEQSAPAVLPDQSATVVTYCASATCQNSADAARRLEALGYTGVHEYAAGKQDWEQAGLPLVREESEVNSSR